MLGTIILCFAFCFAIFEAFGVPPLRNVKWGWFSLAFFELALLLGPVVTLPSLLR